MGVIQSSVNQAISSAGQAAGYLKVLSNQKKIGEGVKDVEDKALYTEEQKKSIAAEKAKQLEEIKRERKKIAIAALREQMMREDVVNISNFRQSTRSRVRNEIEDKERELFKKTTFGGYLNG